MCYSCGVRIIHYSGHWVYESHRRSLYIYIYLALSSHALLNMEIVDCDTQSVSTSELPELAFYLQNTLLKVHHLKFFELQLNTDSSWSPSKYQNLALSAKFWYFEGLQLDIVLRKKRTLATLWRDSLACPWCSGGSWPLVRVCPATVFLSLIFAHSRHNQRKYVRKKNGCIHFRAKAQRKLAKISTPCSAVRSRA